MSKREDIQAALYARLTDPIVGVQGLNFKSRYYVDFSRISQAQQPAIAVVALAARADRSPGLPPKWTQHAVVIFYVRTENNAVATPETQLFSLIEQAETALQRQPTERGGMTDDFGTTLGGLVWSCHLVDMHIHHGVGEGQAAASLTVEMLSLS